MRTFLRGGLNVGRVLCNLRAAAFAWRVRSHWEMRWAARSRWSWECWVLRVVWRESRAVVSGIQMCWASEGWGRGLGSEVAWEGYLVRKGCRVDSRWSRRREARVWAKAVGVRLCRVRATFTMGVRELSWLCRSHSSLEGALHGGLGGCLVEKKVCAWEMARVVRAS
jgi:hypothetical protein